MSTTPSTTDTQYTIVGGTRVQHSGPDVRGLGAILLDRGSRTIRGDSLERLVEAGLDEVVCVLGPAPRYDVEQLAARISNVRFVLLRSDVTAGEQINVGMRESRSHHVLVTWSDVDIPGVSQAILDRLKENEQLCAVPAIRNERGVTLPSVTIPAFQGTTFRTIPVQPGRQHPHTLCPYDYIGIYNREKFTGVGGFDPAIENPYWQRMDLGLRSYLWGERLGVMSDLRVQATRPAPADDTSRDAGYARFHLKNLAVKFAGDSGRIPFRHVLSFLFAGGLGVREGLRLNREVRAWLKETRYRFVQDARRVTELWEARA